MSECVCTTQNLLSCTVADAGLLENEMKILVVAMISKVKVTIRESVFRLWKM